MSKKDEIISIIEQAMPKSSEIKISGSNVNVSWKLSDDPDRSNKMSKTISIHVSEEALEDFTNSADGIKVEALRRITKYLYAKLEQFEPNHNKKKHEEPPVEKWLINSTLLFG